MINQPRMQLSPRQIQCVNVARHIADRTVAFLERERIARDPNKSGRKELMGKPILVVWPHPMRAILMVEPAAIIDADKLRSTDTVSALQDCLHRRVVVTEYDRIFIQAAYAPTVPERVKLPSHIPLDLANLPRLRPYHVALGQGERGDVALDLAVTNRAILIGGFSGCGKSNLIKSILLQLARTHSPAEVQVALCDLKHVDFGPMTPYASLPHLYGQIAYTFEDATEKIEAVYGEYLRRQRLLAQAGVDDWQKLPRELTLPLLLLVIDEIARLAKTPAMATLCDLGREGRAMGISILAATQHPTSDVIDSQLKANLPTCLAFQTRTELESRTILGRKGAEDLRNPGRALGFIGKQWQEVQVLEVGEDTALALLGPPSRPAKTQILSKVELVLVRYAVEQMGGAFTVNGLYDALKAGEMEQYGANAGDIGKNSIMRLAKLWEAREWLTKPGRDADGHKTGRCVTPELLKVAGLPTSPALFRSCHPPTPRETTGEGALSPADTPYHPCTPNPSSQDSAPQDVLPENDGEGDDELPAFLRHRGTD